MNVPEAGHRGEDRALRPRLSPWRFVVAFGVVSLLADIVYEGARSVTGPLLAHLGATAVLVGVVTGVGEAAALLLRLFTGVLADRTQRFWAFTLAGYALTVLSVPLLGIAGALWVACALIIAERVGKAVRSPAKDAMVSYATSHIGRGRGFAVHEAMDQIGAVTGPLVVAGVLAVTGNNYAPALAVLALPGVLTMALLVWLRQRVPQPAEYEAAARSRPDATGAAPVPAYRAEGDALAPDVSVAGASVAGAAAAEAPARDGVSPGVPGGTRARLPKSFWQYSIFTAITMAGFGTFGVISFHLVRQGLLADSAVPVLYAIVMLVDAAAALATGWVFDRSGPQVLVVLPIVAATVPIFAFTGSIFSVVVGALLWGVALGIQESTLRATVAELVPTDYRSTAYGIFAGVVGAATAVGGALTGFLYHISVLLLITVTILIQATALALFWLWRMTAAR